MKQGRVLEMLKRLKRNFVVILLSVLLALSVSVNLVAANGLTEITAYLNATIKVVLHGKEFVPIEPSDGTRMVPITYKGRTYLPLRAVAEAVGLKVTYDANTATAYLGDTEGDIGKKTIHYIRVSPEYLEGSGADLYKLKSRTPELLSRAPGKSFEFGYATDEEYYAGLHVFVKTNYEYDKFKATFWVDERKYPDGSYMADSPKIEIRDEHDVLVKKLDAQFGKLYEVEVDVKDVKVLNVWVTGSLSVIGEPMIGK